MPATWAMSAVASGWVLAAALVGLIIVALAYFPGENGKERPGALADLYK